MMTVKVTETTSGESVWLQLKKIYVNTVGSQRSNGNTFQNNGDRGEFSEICGQLTKS
jgi:hypothetical protein